LCPQYGIKKKEAPPIEDPGLDGRLGRKKKTPEEMEAEANGELPPGGASGEGALRYDFYVTHAGNRSLFLTRVYE